MHASPTAAFITIYRTTAVAKRTPLQWIRNAALVLVKSTCRVQPYRISSTYLFWLFQIHAFLNDCFFKIILRWSWLRMPQFVLNDTRYNYIDTTQHVGLTCPDQPSRGYYAHNYWKQSDRYWKRIIWTHHGYIMVAGNSIEPFMVRVYPKWLRAMSL